MVLTSEQKQQVITRAMKDETFRDALRSDARAAIRQELQLAIPTDATIHVAEQGTTEVYLVIPEYPADWPAGLSIEALEQRLTPDLGALQDKQQTVVRGQTHLIAKAWHDADFKQALLQNPRAVIEQEFEAGLPAELTLRVVAEDARTQYLVLPPVLSDLELSDEQLEQVAGGEFFVASLVIIWTITAGVSAAGSYVAATQPSGW